MFLTCRKPIFWLISGTTQSVTNFKPIKNWPKSNAKNAFMYTSKNAPKTYCNSILFAFLFSSNRVGHYPKSNFLGTHIQNHLDMGQIWILRQALTFCAKIFPIHHYYFPPLFFLVYIYEYCGGQFVLCVMSHICQQFF